MNKKRKRVPESAGSRGTQSKQPVAAERHRFSKRPVAPPEHGGWDDYKPALSVLELDMDGPFGWSKIRPDSLGPVLGKLQDFERRTWSETLRQARKQNHAVSIDKLCKQARDRLAERKLDDFDDLISLRLSSVERVWLIRAEHVALVLWWDPEHKV